MSLNTTIDLPVDVIRAYCQRQPIQRLSVFGSILRDDFRPESDVDLLVEFVSGAQVTFLDLYEMQEALHALIGRTVDLRTPYELSRYFRQTIVEGAQVIYERE